MKPHHKFLAFLAILMLAMGAFSSYYLTGLANTAAEDAELSEKIPASLLNLFDRNSIGDYPFEEQKVNWEGKFDVFNYQGRLTYNKVRNEAFGRHQFFPNEENNGLVLVESSVQKVGHYKRHDNEAETNANAAYQFYNALHFFDLKQQKVIARDTIWGDKPPISKGGRADLVNNFNGGPSESKTIGMIQEYLK